jgi:FdhE protein
MLSSFIEMIYRPSHDRNIEVAEQRWHETLERRPDLEPAVELQRRIVTRSHELAAIIDQKLPATLDLNPAQVAAKLSRHTPILVGEPIVVDAGAVVPFVLGFCDDLSSGAAGGAASRLGETLDRGTIDIGSLLAASLGRQQDAIRSKAHHVGVAPDLLWLVAELASGPVAHRLQHQLLTDFPEQDDQLGVVISGWNHGFCAACGSWPAFGERIDPTTRRSLRCSFCGSAWTPAPEHCIYCDESGDSLLTAAVEPTQPSRRLELCRQCGGYLKCIDVGRATPFPLLPVEDLSTYDLDLGAVERGYFRPSMHTFSTGDSLPCPPPPMA